MKMTHIFFDLYGVLVDGPKLTPCYASELGRIMTERYGNHPKEWTEAWLQIRADWDSYYADLDLAGEDGISDLWEGLFRTTRALFRLTGMPEPPREELSQLSRELPELASGICDGLYTDVRAIVDDLANAGYILGITTHALTGQARALLNGGGILPYFTGQIFGVDTTEQYLRDEEYFAMIARFIEVQPERCVVVDDRAHYVMAAQAAGMHGVYIYRGDPPLDLPNADLVLAGDMRPLLDYVTGELTSSS